MSANDPLIRQLREQISDNDRAIVEAINARLKLVAPTARSGCSSTSPAPTAARSRRKA
jgi:chorismate mutase